jgi:urease accessory protein UreH
MTKKGTGIVFRADFEEKGLEIGAKIVPGLVGNDPRPLFRDRRPAAVIGRHARLELAFGCRGGRTVITHAYVEPPFRIGRSFDVNGAAYLILACTGPGVFVGDSLHQRIWVEHDARVLLVSQSALQVHPAEHPNAAIVHHEYHVAAGGELHCHWDPVIPFADARLVQTFELDVSGGSRLYWSDALMSGRATRGERWRFRSLAHELRVTIDNSLKYLERYRLEPRDRAIGRAWIAGSANYVATTLVHHDAATPECAARLQEELNGIDQVRSGIDVVDSRLMIARFLGASGVASSRARALCRDLALSSIFRTPDLAIRR